MNKNLLLLICICLSLDKVQAQPLPSSCVATPEMVNIYRNDVIKTATHRLFEVGSTYKDSVDVPTAFKDTIAKAFYAVYNMPASSLKDTILNLFAYQNYNTVFGPGYFETDSVHIYHNGYDTLGKYSPKTISMSVPDTTAWAMQWYAGNYSNTVNPVVNQLVQRYNITVQNTLISAGYYYFLCSTNRGVNTYGLSKAFNNIIGNQTYTYACKPYPYLGDGNSIQLNYQNTDGLIVTYFNNCGDCPSGCTHGRSWKFKVYYVNCNVEYLGAMNFGLNPGAPLYGYTCTHGPVVPVFFTSVSGSLQGMYSAVQWKVLTQINVKEYIVEKSGDGRQFFAVGSVPATNVLNAAYNWKEATALNGTAWYRIKAVDLDGKVKYSSIVKMTNAKEASFTIFPNPVTNHSFTVQFATPVSGTLQAVLYSASGKQVWASSLGLTPQTLSRNISLPAYLSSGIYTLLLEQNGTPYRQLLMIASE